MIRLYLIVYVTCLINEPSKARTYLSKCKKTLRYIGSDAHENNVMERH